MKASSVLRAMRSKWTLRSAAVVVSLSIAAFE